MTLEATLQVGQKLTVTPGSHVIRLVEKYGETGTAEITLKSKKAQLIETDMMEWNEIAKFAGNTVEVTMKPFEIKTFKIK